MECYYFGTFNPVHKGHIQTAYEVLEKFNFDKIIFVPSNQPPHKKNFIDISHRINMLKLLENEKIKVSDIETTLKTPSYSFQTIEKLKKGEEKLNFIIGYDAFIQIKTWKNPEYIRKNLHFIVLQRRGEEKSEIEKLKDEGYDFVIAENISFVDVSSTQIRENVKSGLSIDNLVDEKVKRYIKENELYRN